MVAVRPPGILNGVPMTPSEIVRQLDQDVVGQSEAKKVLAVAVYTHFKKSARALAESVELVKSNILLIGSTGTGKTLLCETLSRILGAPFVTADATTLAQSEFVNTEIDAILQRLLEKAGGDVSRAQRGLVFIDEVDKLKAVSDRSRASSGESVQHALLKIMEGSQVRLRSGGYMDTTHILFICGGAFVGLSDIVKESGGYGYLSFSTEANDREVLNRLNTRIKPTDLLTFGLIPEFAGRLPVIARLNDLTRDMMVRIMVEPKESIYRQYRELLKSDGVELSIKPAVFEQIADVAMEYKAGARSLRGIFEELMTNVLYEIPDNPAIRKVVFTSLFEPPQLLGEPPKST
jgi:ATP-dependent Clp protease ATP-binding subunit ClpX